MEIESIISKVGSSLQQVKGIEAVVLGGSRARGNFSSHSDIDIGIYYSNSSDLDLERLSQIATEFDDAHRLNLITRIGEWGPWINGGGWLQIKGIPTDFLFRDINKVACVIDDCLNKNITIDYQPGHPHGFPNTVYAAEIFYCNVIWDRNGTIGKLKSRVTPYPLPVKYAVINKFLWEAGFTNGIAYKSLAKNDIVYTAGCLYRVVSCLIQVLYALNETFLMNEKGAYSNIESLEYVPQGFVEIVEIIFSSLAEDSQGMGILINQMAGIIDEVNEVCRNISLKDEI